jgi:hypothetical protein
MHPVTHPFLARHAADVLGMLSGFDRLRFRGTLRFIANADGLGVFLHRAGVLLKHFGEYVDSVTAEVKRATEAVATTAGRPVRYLPRPSADKEAVARAIAEADGITAGLVCTLKSVEPCWSFDVHRNRATKQLDLVSAWRKCLHYYHYLIDPTLGWLHVRLQSWFPFTVYISLNGREWLARQLDAAGVGYQRRGNCFVDLADVAAAQRLADAQQRTAWAALLDGLVRQVHPAHATAFAACPLRHYWSLEQSEWATDVMFRATARLDALYPALVAQAMTGLGSRDVMRFLGKRVRVDGHYRGEVVSDLAGRPEGVRVKHRVNGNAVKMYNKQGSVLRVETVINQPRDLTVYRPKEGDPGGAKDWRYLRKGVADVWRRAELSQQANERYLAAMAAVSEPTPLGVLSQPVCRRVRYRGQPVRALNPLAAEDAALLTAVHRGEYLITGFRNRDVRAVLYGAASSPDPAVARRRSGAVTRKLRLLRAHGLIRKVARTHRYLFTAKGQVLVAALLAARQADTATLAAAA